MDLLTKIKNSETQRIYVESCLLATNNLEDISEVLEIPVDVLEKYSEDVFPICKQTRLEKLEYLSTLEVGTEKQMKLWAVTQGFEFIKWRLGFQVSITPLEGVQSLYADSIFKAKEAFFNNNATDNSREALKWVTESIAIAKLIKSWVADSKEAMKDIELALEKLDGETVTFEPLDKFDDPSVLPDSQEFSSMDIDIEELEKQNANPPMLQEQTTREVKGIDYDLL